MFVLSSRKYLFSVLYALLTAVSLVLIQGLKDVPANVSLFICAVTATLFFHIINGKKLRTVYSATYANKVTWLAVSITIFIIWWVTFYSVQLIGASKSVLIFFTSRAIVGYLYKFLKKDNLWTTIICLLGLAIILVIFYIINRESHKWLLGFAITSVGGLTSYLYGKCSHTLGNNAALTATQILAVRFYVLIAVLLWSVSFSALKYAIESHWLALMIITLFSFILPLYFNQRGIMTAGPEVHAIIAALTPFFTVLLELLVHQTISISTIVFSIIIVLFIAPQFLEAFFQKIQRL